ncbi:hypothetical protein [Medusavirus stheno T3]|uniref:Uncharacterized protein n=1 Tax=Medusavirus stheno T3 TaxID=3069717 RepID=A0A7S7YEV7_9VIRU|nr:hypothetical protein QKU73_gp257 [Acanthamoeba castellanii medusavirus]QPB44518.1 hypothetical protein [Medusavirus stheno T3]
MGQYNCRVTEEASGVCYVEGRSATGSGSSFVGPVRGTHYEAILAVEQFGRHDSWRTIDRDHFVLTYARP